MGKKHSVALFVSIVSILHEAYSAYEYAASLKQRGSQVEFSNLPVDVRGKKIL